MILARIHSPRWTLAFACLAIAAATHLNSQDVVVLRDLKLLRDVNIQDFDLDGVKLTDGGRISWSDIRQATVSNDRQELIDQHIAEIGLPLFRIRQRMKAGDFANLQPHASALRKRLGDAATDGNYLACAAEFQAALYAGDRIKALGPLLHLMHIRNTDVERFRKLDEEAGLRFGRSGLCLNLLPVWFETSSAKLEHIEQLLKEKPHLSDDHSAVYLASLGQAHGKKIRLDKLDDETNIEIWNAILSAQSSLFDKKYLETIKQLDQFRFPNATAEQAIALYYKGLSQLNSEHLKNSTAAITLLQIPANYGRDFPELSAAAIYHVVVNSKDTDGLESLIKELEGPFRKTYFGIRYRETAR